MNLKEIRKSKGMSLSLMAKVLGIPKNTYVKLESGKRQISPEVEKKVQAAFFFKKRENMLLSASFDWVSLHFRTTDAEDVVRRILKLDIHEFSLQEYARYQYPHLYRYGSLNLYVDLKDEKHGVLIECSGAACRELEQLLLDEKRDWYDLFNDCLLYEQVLRVRYTLSQPTEEETETKKKEEKSYFNVTRLDLALDEFFSEEGNYNLLDLFGRFQEGLISTKKRSYSSRMGGSLTQAGNYQDGLTLYLGSAQSSPYFRFYQKDAERAKVLGMSLDSVHDLYGLKNRYEIVLRAEKADQFIRRYVWDYFDIAEQAVGIINANLVVFEDFKGHLDVDWYTLMNSTEAYLFETQPKVLDVTKTWAWAEKVAFPTLAFLKEDDEKKFFEMLGDAKISKRYQSYLTIKDKQQKPKGS